MSLATAEQLAQDYANRYNTPALVYRNPSGEYRVIRREYYISPQLQGHPFDHYENCEIVCVKHPQSLEL